VIIRSAIVILALALAGCGVQSTPAPPVEVRTVTVDRPIPVPCIAAFDVPAMPPRVGDQLTGDAGHDLDVVAASAIRLRAALDKALAVLSGCLLSPAS
jgi:hypothetical protein